MPTAANLNRYRGGRSHVGWHSDNEPLFGERREAKLNVSVSFGTQAPFKWKGKFGPDSDVSSCWLGHGDILVMDGQYQDVLHHCTDPGSEQERINVTFRWIKQHIAACPIAGDFNVESTKIPCLSKGISAGFWVDLEVAWSVASVVTCKRNRESTWGNLVGCPVVAAAVLSCSVCSGRWLQPHFAVRASFDCHRWSCRVTQLV